jgi:hypothetical protein
MRFLANIVLGLALVGGLPVAAAADPEPEGDAPVSVDLEEESAHRLRVGTEVRWCPAQLGRRVGLGLGWSLPQRWYDADGQLLTERSLLNPGEDLERSGFYFALRF